MATSAWPSAAGRLPVSRTGSAPGVVRCAPPPAVAASLQDRGFVVEEVANDPTEREVTGVGELRHGPRGNDAAAYVRLFVPGSGDFLDTRATATVDVVIGPDWAGLAPPEEVDAALVAGASAAAAC